MGGARGLHLRRLDLAASSAPPRLYQTIAYVSRSNRRTVSKSSGRFAGGRMMSVQMWHYRSLGGMP
jgi:hypothetical protein